jgi:hypothetical protein
MILYAVEAGSRAWGFASPDSDYDVRFIYIRPSDEYLRIDKTPDTIVHMSESGRYDFVGWDLKKALFLLKKSNPGIVEWMQAGELYTANTPFYTDINTLLYEHYFNPRAAYQRKHKTPAPLNIHTLAKATVDEKLEHAIMQLVDYKCCRHELTTLPSNGLVDDMLDKVSSDYQKRDRSEFPVLGSIGFEPVNKVFRKWAATLH